MTRQSKHPFYKQPWFIGLTAVIGLAGTVVALINGIKEFRKPEPAKQVMQNTEVILDRSKGMEQSFPDGTTKLKLARKAVDLVLGRETVGDNLAFRAFGGFCDDSTPSPPTLPFSTENAGSVREKIKGLEAKGEATLIAAIKHTIADFYDVARFGGVNKRIIVIAGNLDACGRDIIEIVQQLNRLADSQGKAKEAIALDLNFIGIGLDAAAKLEFDNYAERTGGAAHFADNPQQLENVIEIIEAARVERAAIAISSLLRASGELLGSVITDLRNNGHAAAERDFQKARDEFARSELPFQDLVKRQTSGQLSPELTGQYRRIYQAASRSRELQSQVLSLTQTMLQAKSLDEPSLKPTINKYEEVRAAYNQSDDELQALLVQLKAMARRSR